MKDWKEVYASKIVTADEAISHVKSGDKIALTHACGESQCLTNALVAQADRLENVEILHIASRGWKRIFAITPCL